MVGFGSLNCHSEVILGRSLEDVVQSLEDIAQSQEDIVRRGRWGLRVGPAEECRSLFQENSGANGSQQGAKIVSKWEPKIAQDKR